MWVGVGGWGMQLGTAETSAAFCPWKLCGSVSGRHAPIRPWAAAIGTSAAACSACRRTIRVGLARVYWDLLPVHHCHIIFNAVAHNLWIATERWVEQLAD